MIFRKMISRNFPGQNEECIFADQSDSHRLYPFEISMFTVVHWTISKRFSNGNVSLDPAKKFDFCFLIYFGQFFWSEVDERKSAATFSCEMFAPNPQKS